MTGVKRAAKSAARFSERDVWFWRQRMGTLRDTEIGVVKYALDHDEVGCKMSDRTVVVPVCLYVAVDDADRCLYIGQCRRPGGSVVQRIHHHHAIPVEATALWVLPMRSDCSKDALTAVETQMIWAYRPPYNTANCPLAFRAVAS